MPLRGRASFRRVFRSGTRHRVGGLTVITMPGDPGRSRIGIVASRSVGGAVARNRAKRRIRGALARLALSEASDAIVIASREVVTAEFVELVKWLESAFRIGEEK